MDIQCILSNKSNVIKTGPIQFNDDWPGIFMSVGYVKHYIQPLEQQGLLSTPDMFARNYLVSLVNDIYNSLQEFHVIDDYDDVSTIQIVETNSFNNDFRRVETGVIKINDQIGYFIRGDMAGYISYLAKLIKEPDHIYLLLQNLLSRSRV